MTLTYKQCDLLINVFNAGLERAASSGFPIDPDYYSDIDAIKAKLYREHQEACEREIPV